VIPRALAYISRFHLRRSPIQRPVKQDQPFRRRLLQCRGLLAGLLLLGCLAPRAQDLTQEECDADRQAMLEGISANRAEGVRFLHGAIATAPTEEARAMLRYELEKVWDFEEQEIAVADRNWRECVRHVRRLSTSSR
jgi:hypothetical protein